jgi:hypothetical protein
MKPDRSNYEIWFTDWLDGNLSKEQAEELKVFLEENPDLKEELNGLELVSLNPPDIIFSGKAGLGRSPESLSDIEFEHLCIAGLENDLTPGQKAELIEIIGRNEARRRSFEIVQKLRLKPMAGSFTRKSIVKKLTIGQKILRLSAIGISAAAIVSLVIGIYLFTSEDTIQEPPQIAQNLTPDTLLIDSGQIVIKGSGNGRRIFKPAIIRSIPEIRTSEVNILIEKRENHISADSVIEFQRPEALAMIMVPIPENLLTCNMNEANEILTYKPAYIPPLIDNRSNVQLFLARVFHEKIMKDNSGTRPVESFEIAQAGIKGLNKLFGWEIALHKTTDVNGDIRSYNFSSKLIKVNAPVKKSVKAL